MLALAPDDVRLDLMPGDGDVEPGQDEAIGRQIRDRGVTRPCPSGQPDLATNGLIGDPRGANAELGRLILLSALEAASAALDRPTRRTPTPGGPMQLTDTEKAESKRDGMIIRRGIVALT